jgi:cyclopropane fatty-acyl-phospholipid synthase-like methyltransferase
MFTALIVGCGRGVGASATVRPGRRVSGVSDKESKEDLKRARKEVAAEFRRRKRKIKAQDKEDRKKERAERKRK